MIVLSIILIILMMTEFNKVILARLKMFYIENEQNGRRVLIMQKFWGEIWYMSTLFTITFDRKIALMKSLQHWKLDFKSFPTVYYKSNSDNWPRNGDHLKFAEIVRQNADSVFWLWMWMPSRIFSFGIRAVHFSILQFCIIYFYLYFN